MGFLIEKYRINSTTKFHAKMQIRIIFITKKIFTHSYFTSRTHVNSNESFFRTIKYVKDSPSTLQQTLTEN